MIEMIILTILNTLFILFIFVHQQIIKVTIRRDETFSKHTLTGYNCWISKFYFRIPIRNKRKTELHEEVCSLIASSGQNKLQTLTAKFSWLKTKEEVSQFEKDYSVVDSKIVERLVSNFVVRPN